MSKSPSEVKRAHSSKLLSLPNVVGLGVGPRRGRAEGDVEMAIKVFVSRKLPLEDLAEAERIPSELDGVPVEVEVMAPLRRRNPGSEDDGSPKEDL